MTGSDGSPPSPHSLDGPAQSTPSSRSTHSQKIAGSQRPSLKNTRHATFPSPKSSSASATSSISMSTKASTPATITESGGTQPKKLKRHPTVGSVPHGLTNASLRASASAATSQSLSKRRSGGPKFNSPTLEAAFQSPTLSEYPGASTGSAKSTSSTGTIVAPSSQGGKRSVQTPSYPFPYVPTPGGRSRPPDINQSSANLQYSSLSRHTSLTSTPRTAARRGSSTGESIDDVSLFPSPDLNNLVLQLNSDPDLEYWWSVTCEAMRDWYKATRVSLAVPADSNDIENVPWGQKASFNISGLKNRAETNHQIHQASIGTDDTSPRNARKASKSESATTRPSLGKRQQSHSTIDSHDGYIQAGFAPRWPLRTPSDYPDFVDSSFDEITQIFSSLQPLDAEVDSLLDSWGVNPILERGRSVVLCREYPQNPEGTVNSDPEDSRSEIGTTRSDGYRHEEKSTEPQKSSFRKSTTYESRKGSSVERVSFVDAAVDYSGTTRRPSRYEEYEQVPASPWSQSPAPSPAIQADPEENPFFATGNLDEESFSTPTREDYLQYDQVEAIGVDQGVSTVVHVPLVHPLLSRVMPALTSNDPSYDGAEKPERRAPLAILSIQASAVPYPRNLLESLDMLAPHLATSFHTCSLTSARVGEINRRKSLTGMERGLGNLLQLDLDDTTSSTDLASPSDRSVRSMSGTSNQEGLGVAVSGKQYPPGTPGAASLEAADSYFDARKRMSLNRAHSTGYVPQLQSHGHSGSQLVSNRPATSDQRSTTKISKETPGQSSQISSKTSKRHSVLHSYGADFAASFPSLPVTAIPHTPGSQSGEAEMAPPSEKLLRTIIDSLPLQIFTAAPESGAITYVNSKFLVYRGQNPFHGTQTPKQVLAIHEDDVDSWLAAWDRSLRTGQEFQQKVRLRRFDETYRWFYIKTAFLRDRHQNVVHVIGTCMDFHEQYVAEISAARAKEMAASEAKYRALANSSPQIVFAATRKKGVTFCNSQWLHYSGQSEEDAIGAGFMNNVHPDDIVKCKLPIFDDSGSANVPVSVTDSRRHRSIASPAPEPFGESYAPLPSFDTASPTGMPQRKLSELAGAGIMKVSQDEAGKPSYSTEVRLRNKHGEYRWHLVRVLLAEPLLNEEAREETWFGSCADINDHKELEKTLKETMDAKSRFLSNMSHEIRTPLNGIHGMSQILIDSSNLTGEQMEHLNVIKTSTEGLRDLINDILDLSKVEAGMITLSKEWIQIRPIIEEVNDLTTSLIMDKNIDLNYIVEQDVPSKVMGDKFRIRQVLLNIIGNAIKFTLEGEVLVRCGLAPSTEDDPEGTLNLRFDIMDTGRGFTDTEAERLFKRFSQIDGSSTRQHGGSGLGLVISMQLVELHGGSMTATGRPGKGSTFSFTINVGVGKPDEDSSPEERRTATSGYVPPRFLTEQSGDSASSTVSRSPGQLDTPSLSSSGSSDPAIRFALSAAPSKSSSASSVMPDPVINLSIPSRLKTETQNNSDDDGSNPSNSTLSQQQPMLYSILVVCPLMWARESAIKHLENALPLGVPHQITPCTSADECRQLMQDQGLTFSHVIAIFQDSRELMDLVGQVLTSSSLPSTSVIVVTGLGQKQKIVDQHSEYDFNELAGKGRLRFVFKPLKLSKISETFDPMKSRGLNSDLAHSGSQRVARVQKQVFDDMAKRLGNKGHRVLLVEDNKVNQLVMLKLLNRTSINVDTANDGKQCTDKFFAAETDYYSIILCDLHMPVKDGYQTCRDIRQFEKSKGRPHIPIIALSANVLGDVYAKCAAAGFNSYLTKPVEFKELSETMTAFLDRDQTEPLEFMQHHRV